MVIFLISAAMIITKDLRAIARARLRDAQALLRARRFDGAFYICGYAVELALKARICQTLRWLGFPEDGKEFKGLLSLKTHDLEILLKLSGIEDRIKVKHSSEWSVAIRWNPEDRYRLVGSTTPFEGEEMVTCVERLLEVL